MKIKRKMIVEQDIRYLVATMGVRYWQDCEYSTDGENWIDPCVDDTEEESENMKQLTPCIVNIDIGYRPSDYWQIIIDLEEGKVLNWKEGFYLRTHYKVCDDGKYVFEDENFNTIVDITNEYEQYYVPDFLALEDSGYGDYVYLNIDGNGNIEHFDRMLSEIKDYFENIDKED